MRYPSKKKESLSSLRTALQLLKLYSLEEPEFTISDFAERLQIGLSTAHRLASTLQNEGFLLRDPSSKRFRLSATVMGMGVTVTSQIDYLKSSIPILEKLANDTGETAHIAILKQDKVLYLHKVDSTHPVHLLSHSGRQNPLHATSTGQVILAYQTESFIHAYLEKGLFTYTDKTIVTPEQLNVALQTIKNQGYAISEEELHEGVSSIAAPIKRINGEVYAAVSIAGPTSRFSLQKTNKLVKKVIQAAEDISKQSLFLIKAR